MDFQNRVGSKPGAAAPASASEVNVAKKARVRSLAMEVIDQQHQATSGISGSLSKDPFLMRNHIGMYECRLCLTIHVNEGGYLAHCQGRKHKMNLERRRLREAQRDNGISGHKMGISAENAQYLTKPAPKKNLVKIGRPGYRVTKIRDPSNYKLGLLFQVHYPLLDQDKSKNKSNSNEETAKAPKFRIMSAFEQKVETQDRRYQYLILSAVPYENIAFKIPNWQLDEGENGSGIWDYWDVDTKLYTLQILFDQTNLSGIVPSKMMEHTALYPQ